jgi:DNA-binding transcriptional MerR regulator
MSRWEIEMSRYSLAELAELTGIQARTIRSYIEKGIIPGPERPGRHAYYEDEHLDRLLALVALRSLDQLTLEEVRRKLLGLNREEIRALAREGNPDAHAARDDAEAEESFEDYIRRAREELAASSASRNHDARPSVGAAPLIKLGGRPAFGKKGSADGLKPGGRPAFGVARPMKGAGVSPAHGGEQFSPIPDEAAPEFQAQKPAAASLHPISSAHAIDRLNERIAAISEASSEVGGYESSIHKIKEQVLPRLLELVDPEAAATLSKVQLSEEFRPIIMKVTAELNVTLNRREQFALEKVLFDELTGREPAPTRLVEAPRYLQSTSIKVEMQTRVEVTRNVDLIVSGPVSRKQLRLLEEAAAELRERLLGNSYDD